MGVVVSQDARTVGEDLLVQGDRIAQAPRLPEGALPGFSARIIRDLLRPSDSDRNAKARDDLAETLRGGWPAARAASRLSPPPVAGEPSDDIDDSDD